VASVLTTCGCLALGRGGVGVSRQYATGAMEHEYVIEVAVPGGKTERYKHRSSSMFELVEREVIDLGGREIMIDEIVEKPRRGQVGLAKGSRFARRSD
jgi:hypothetical protein